MIPELLEKIGGVVTEQELRYQLRRRGRRLIASQLQAAIDEGLVAREPGGYRSTAPPKPRKPRARPKRPRRPAVEIQAERRQIAVWWAQGLTISRIAAQLGVSVPQADGRIASMRDAGWHLPHRSPGCRPATAPTATVSSG